MALVGVSPERLLSIRDGAVLADALADLFTEQQRGMGLAHEAVRQALVNLEAVDAPAGMMPVVLGPGWPGVLLHEAVGHGLEGDFNRKGTSTFSGRLGEQVASPLCTVVDDGTLEGRRGSLNIDDEGTDTRYNVLIEKGVLKGYMQDKHNAKLMGVAPTGNGSLWYWKSSRHAPEPRERWSVIELPPHQCPERDWMSSMRALSLEPVFFRYGIHSTTGKSALVFVSRRSSRPLAGSRHVTGCTVSPSCSTG